MTRSYRLTPTARAQLRRSYLYSVREFGDRQSDIYFTGLRKTFERLVSFPRLGTLTSPGSPVRKTVYERHNIFYRETPEGIEIGRIYGSGQDFTRSLATYRREAQRLAERERTQTRSHEQQKD